MNSLNFFSILIFVVGSFSSFGKVPLIYMFGVMGTLSAITQRYVKTRGYRNWEDHLNELMFYSLVYVLFQYKILDLLVSKCSFFLIESSLSWKNILISLAIISLNASIIYFLVVIFSNVLDSVLITWQKSKNGTLEEKPKEVSLNDFFVHMKRSVSPELLSKRERFYNFLIVFISFYLLVNHS
jgi:hypothetical protein